MNVEKNSRVAFQGERGAFSEQAAIELLGDEIILVPRSSFEAAFAAIEEGLADYVLAPIENSLAGSVYRSFDLLVKSRLNIIGEVIIPIAHHLIGLPGAALDQIVTVSSHPVALAQCEQFFAAHPRIKRAVGEDTAGSVRDVVDSGDPTRAAIAGKRAAQIYGAAILMEHLEDNRENYTRFLLLSGDPVPLSDADKISLVFELDHRPGALYRALDPFARRGINLMKIESRPMHGSPWQYRFYLDLQLSAGGEGARSALADLEGLVNGLRVLGSYASAKGARSNAGGGRAMIVNMFSNATEEEINHVLLRIRECGFQPHLIQGEERTVIGVVGDSNKRRSELEALRAAPGVEELVPISHPFKLASRSCRPEGSVVELGKGVTIGGAEVVVAAGPCAVESPAQVEEIARCVARLGAKLLRGGAFKPRTSPYAFQGLGEEGLKLLRAAADQNGLIVVSEVMDPSQLELMLRYVDVLQVGARNMQNYHLLRALGEVEKPVLLKRGMSATMEELLLSAEYIMSGGNYKVVLCERGIRTFETYTRNTLDIAAIPVLKQLSHLPVIADPSHGTGRRDKVAALARAAVAAGADGLLIEVHPDPERALSDGVQSLYPDQFAQLMAEIRMIAPAVGRRIA